MLLIDLDNFSSNTYKSLKHLIYKLIEQGLLFEENQECLLKIILILFKSKINHDYYELFMHSNDTAQKLEFTLNIYYGVDTITDYMSINFN